MKNKTERQLLDEIRWDEQKMETVDNNPLGNYGYWHEHNNSLRWNGWLKIEQMEALLNSLKKYTKSNPKRKIVFKGLFRRVRIKFMEAR